MSQVDELIAKIKDKDANVRTQAWLGAGQVGAAAIGPLAAVVVGSELEIGRAAQRGMWQIVRHAGRPGADDERKTVVAALLPLLGADRPAPVRVEAMWMLSEIAGDEAVAPVAALLSNMQLREDARLVLDRIPGEKSLAALRAGLTAAPDDFKINLAESLRHRGVEVPGLPSQKLVPTKATSVK
ncbi:MAG: HEAT repeat domain-containing protein [Pirellulales bacterium]